MYLADKKVFVTGASSGIGCQVAKSFAQTGCRVALSARSEYKLERICREIEDAGGKAFSYPADVLDSRSLKDSIDSFAKDMGGIDIVAHCAGMTIKSPLQDMPLEDWDTVLDSNLKSAYYMARFSYKYLKESAKNGNAKFIAIGSVGTYLGIPLSAAYCASKGGLVQLVKTLAVEWAKDNINVNAICPGYILTPLSESVLKIGETYQKVTSRIPMKRIGDPQDIAIAALFLASPMSDYITATTLNVDGGLISAAYTMDN